jgi:hypothetical protein
VRVEINVLFSNGRSQSYELFYYNNESYLRLINHIYEEDSKFIKIRKCFDDTVKKNSVVCLKREEVVSIDLNCYS